MNKWHTICITVGFVAFFTVLSAPGIMQRHYDHQLEMAKVKAGCTK